MWIYSLLLVRQRLLTFWTEWHCLNLSSIYWDLQGVPKNALSESSSCKLTPQRDQIQGVLNLISLRCQLAGWWFWKCVFLGHPAYNSQNFRSFNLRKQSNQVYYFHWSQYLGLGRCCWGADTLDPVGDKYIALHSCCDIQEEIPLLTWNLIPLKMSGTEPPSKGFILTSLIFRLRIWRGGHGIDENALSHHSSPQGTRTR